MAGSTETSQNSETRGLAETVTVPPGEKMPGLAEVEVQRVRL